MCIRDRYERPLNSLLIFNTMAKDTINIGIVGLGFMAAMHIRAYRQIDGANIAAICDLDPERLAAAFDATPSADEYEKVEDPLGLALARSATMSSSEMLSGSEGKKKKKEKKAKKEKKEKKGEKSASKSKSGKSMRDWDESD